MECLLAHTHEQWSSKAIMERQMADSLDQALELEAIGHREMHQFLNELALEYDDADDFDCVALGMFKAMIEGLIVSGIEPIDIFGVCVGIINETLDYDEERLN